MPDLEEKISAWRSQMLVTGIRSPVPLDELEAHLRDHIANLKADLTEPEAFQTAVNQLGDGNLLKREFSKTRQWFLRGNPLALTLVVSLFFLIGLNLFSQLVRFCLVDWAFGLGFKEYFILSLLGVVSLLSLATGWGLLRRRASSRRCAWALIVLGLLSLTWAEIVHFKTPPAAGSYYILLGIFIPMRLALFQDLLVTAMLLWSGHTLNQPAIRQLFYRDTKTKTP